METEANDYEVKTKKLNSEQIQASLHSVKLITNIYRIQRPRIFPEISRDRLEAGEMIKKILAKWKDVWRY